MKILINYIEGEKNSNSLGIGSISLHLSTLLKQSVCLNRYSYTKVNNSLLRQLFIYIFYPVKIWFLLCKTPAVIHISSQGYAHLAHFLPTHKMIITCCDVIPLIYSSKNGYFQKLLLRFTFSGLKKAKKIIAISTSTKKDLVKYLHIPDEKIKVIYPGVSKQFKPLGFKKKNFILYVGAYYASKNLSTLFTVFSRAKNTFPDLRLVIVNDKGKLPKNLAKLMEKEKIQSSVEFTGKISEIELIKLYNQALLLVHPSFYEGFGLPVLEAMACGCPVVTGNSSSLPEIVGDAGMMISPTDVSGFSKAIEKIISNQKLRKTMSINGINQAKKFSWLRTADETFKIYTELISLQA